MSEQSKPEAPVENSDFTLTNGARPSFGQVGNQGKSALLRENFMCNIADAISSTGIFPDHYRHRRDSAYRAGDFKKADLEENMEEDGWVNLTNKTAKSGPIQISPRTQSSPERLSMRTRSPSNPTFNNARLFATSFSDANVAWAVTHDTDMAPAVVGQPDNSKFILRRYDIRDPSKIQKKWLELNIDGFDWNNEEHIERLNKARRHWEVTTLESNPQTSGKSR